jgi:hypothetical protein
MKKYLIFVFLIIILFSSCNKNKEWEDIDWLFNIRFITVDELKSQIKLNFVTNWNVGNKEGWTYNYSNNEFDYEYRFNFTNNKLEDIETIIKPINISQQEYNLKLRKYIAKKFKLASFTGTLPEQGFEFGIENLLINGVRFEIYFRNRQLSSSLFGKWEFKFDNKIISDVNDKIVIKHGYSINRDALLENIKNYKQIWEINSNHIIINDNKFEYDLVDNDIVFYSIWIGYGGDRIESEITRKKYTIEKNNTIIIDVLFKELFRIDDSLIFNDDFTMYLIGNKIE